MECRVPCSGDSESVRANIFTLNDNDSKKAVMRPTTHGNMLDVCDCYRVPLMTTAAPVDWREWTIYGIVGRRLMRYVNRWKAWPHKTMSSGITRMYRAGRIWTVFSDTKQWRLLAMDRMWCVYIQSDQLLVSACFRHMNNTVYLNAETGRASEKIYKLDIHDR